MSHFAKIESGIVVQVIVADQEFVNTLTGTWIKTSYNTRRGVHYTREGRPSGQTPLRKNFAGAGAVYDKTRDAFYDSRPSNFAYLDEASYTWKQCLPFNPLVPSLIPEKNVKFYVSPSDFNTVDLAVWTQLHESLGVEFVTVPTDATYALPLTDLQSYNLVTDPTLERLSPFTLKSFLSIVDRVEIQKQKISALPCTLFYSESELLSLPKAPVFLKHRRTILKTNTRWDYTTYSSPAELASTLTPDFWQYQQSPSIENGEFIVQSALPVPLSSLNIHISVNSKSEVLIWAKAMRAHITSTQLGSYQPADVDCTKLQIEIEATCTELGITGSFHELEFVNVAGVWELMDWNPRLTGPFINSLALAYPVLNAAFAHMLGLPVDLACSELYYEQRSYDRIADDVMNNAALSVGLFPKTGAMKVQLSSIGETSSIVNARFSKFESALADSSILPGGQLTLPM